MSQYPRAPGRPDRPAPPAGSIRAARERMENGGDMRDPRRAPAPPRQDASPPRNGPISRPAPMPQWPLTNEVSSPNSQTPQQGSGRSPPRRPPRPSYVPSILDASRIQDHTPAFQYRQQQAQAPTQYPPDRQQQAQNNNQYPSDRQQRYWDPSYNGSAQDATTPSSGFSGNSSSSRPLTTSSYGSIPDFPVPAYPPTQPAPPSPQSLQAPQVQPQARRSVGPPPSARRGASSYYSHTSFVAPIPEEIPESPKIMRGQRGPQHGSYASSHVMPHSWADGPPAYYTGPYPEEEDDDDYDAEGRGSRASDHDESTNLVRKASLGKQFKPTLTTVRSSSSSGSDELRGGKVPKIPTTNESGAMRSEGLPSSPAVDRLNGLSPSGKGLYLAPIDTGLANSHSTRSTGPSPMSSQSNQSDPVKQIMGGLEKGGAIERGVSPPLVTPQARRPPRLNIDAVHEAEARGSLTSLTDLIRRATKARTNLEKGRTASRLGMLDFGTSSNPNLLLEKMGGNHKRNSDSLSGILSSFPPPAQTPQGERPSSRWPSPFANSNLNLAQTAEHGEGKGGRKPGRRCCGLPLWVFLLLLFMLLLFIAAAITVPIVLIVLPRMRDQNNNAADLSKCASTHPCENGGQSVVSANSCRCVCTGGFTGSSCATKSDSDCTSSDVASAKDATMGKSIPRLFSSSQTSFSIPLNSTSLLSTFAAANVSCSDEEALITFNGKAQRRDVSGGSETIPSSPSITAPSFLEHAAVSAAPSAVTSNGIILDSAAGTPIPTAQTVTGSAPSATTQPTPTPSSKAGSPSSKDLDFARVAVLWILQQTQQLDTAVSAQQSLKAKLSGDFTAEIVDLPGGVKVDFSKRKVTVNGTTVGG